MLAGPGGLAFFHLKKKEATYAAILLYTNSPCKSTSFFPVFAVY